LSEAEYKKIIVDGILLLTDAQRNQCNGVCLKKDECVNREPMLDAMQRIEKDLPALGIGELHSLLFSLSKKISQELLLRFGLRNAGSSMDMVSAGIVKPEQMKKLDELLKKTDELVVAKRIREYDNRDRFG